MTHESMSFKSMEVPNHRKGEKTAESEKQKHVTLLTNQGVALCFFLIRV